MKYFSGIVLFLLCLVPVDGLADAERPGSDVSELWFPVGEQLVHKIYWGFVPVGRSVTTTEWIDKGGRTLLAIRMKTRTNKVFDKIRPVNDVVESIVDPKEFRPVTFRRRMIRREVACDETTVFDYDKKFATWTSKCSGETKTFEIEPTTRDILTFLYYSRKSGFKEFAKHDFKVMADDGIFDLKIKTGKKRKVDLPLFGEVQSLRIDPEFAFDGLLVANEKFSLWVSEDQRRLLTRAVIKGAVADIKIVLCGVSGPGNDFWAKITKEKGFKAIPGFD